jgi:hypothetical protein
MLQTLGARTAYGLARDEIWPLVHFLRHLEADHTVEFCPSHAGHPEWDIEVYFSAEAPRRFQIKTTGPRWPRSDGSLADFGSARRALTLLYGTGVSNFGPRQADFLGEEFGDSERMIPKRRLLRATALGIRDVLKKTSEKYSSRHSRSLGDVELLIHVWGLSHYFVRPQEFEAIARLTRRSTPNLPFQSVILSGDGHGQMQVIK